MQALTILIAALLLVFVAGETVRYRRHHRLGSDENQ